MTEKCAENTNFNERQSYLKAHAGEYPFPLNGSNWARLIREKQFLDRHPHCKCESCQNFLTRLHDHSAGPLRRQRSVIAKAMHHWFLHDTNGVAMFWSMRDQLTAHELAKAKIVDVGEGTTMSLIDAEREWLSKKIYSKPDHPGLLDAEQKCDSACLSIDDEVEVDMERITLETEQRNLLISLQPCRLSIETGADLESSEPPPDFEI